MNLRRHLIAAACLACLANPSGSAGATGVEEGAVAALPAVGEVVNAAARQQEPITDADLWQRIRAGFQLEPLDSQLVYDNEEWYARRPDYIQRFVERGSKYLHHIVEEVEKRGMPMEIALLPVIESAFNPKAYSRSHAAGMWQFIPSTGKNFGLSQNWWADHRRDVLASTSAALTYLQKLHGMFGSWELAIAAYNCGEGCVGRAIAKNQKAGLPTDFLSLKLPNETRNYVPKLIAVKNIVLAPASYGIELEALKDEPYFTTVKAPAKIDVKLAAQLAGMPEDEFVALNPAFNKPVAAAESGHFLLPIEKAEIFRDNLEAWDRPLVSWTTYAAKRGESVDAIAKRFGVTGGHLRAVNGKLKERKGKLAQPMLIMVPGQNGGFIKAALKSSPAAPAAAPAAPVAPATGPYTIRSGDTLYSIAQRFGVPLDDLLRWNRMTARSVIQPGKQIRVSA